jgi:hypothetical protein
MDQIKKKSDHDNLRKKTFYKILFRCHKHVLKHEKIYMSRVINPIRSNKFVLVWLDDIKNRE